tara:strand:+ start:479 stop:1534 length:1056 start_codon:yes stop_codon:yes gene_type:complete
MGFKKPGFNGQGSIDLSDYDSLTPRDQIDAKFLHFDFLNLDEVPIDDDCYFNLAIRTETPDEFRKRVDDIRINFETNGFKMTYWPPCFGTDGKPRDGRGRIKAAKENGEKWLPIAVYDYRSDSNLNYITNGILANDHDPAVRPKLNDFVTAAVTLISINELENDWDVLSDWLYHKVKIERFMKGQHNYTKILNQISDIADNGDSTLVDLRSSDDWKSWIKTNLKWEDRTDYILTAVNNVTYVNRTWCENILPKISKGDTPVNIVLYTKSRTPEVARADVSKFVKAIDKHYATSYKMVNDELGSKMSITVPEKHERPYRFVGAVPQFYGKHCGVDSEGNQILANKLISLSDY